MAYKRLYEDDSYRYSLGKLLYDFGNIQHKYEKQKTPSVTNKLLKQVEKIHNFMIKYGKVIDPLEIYNIYKRLLQQYSGKLSFEMINDFIRVMKHNPIKN